MMDTPKRLESENKKGEEENQTVPHSYLQFSPPFFDLIPYSKWVQGKQVNFPYFFKKRDSSCCLVHFIAVL